MKVYREAPTWTNLSGLMVRSHHLYVKSSQIKKSDLQHQSQLFSGGDVANATRHNRSQDFFFFTQIFI